MKNNNIEIVKEEALKLLELMGINAKIEVSEDKENEAIKVQVETDEPGILIGFHGDTLSSYQLILGVIAGKKIGEWKRVVVNIGDYREKREEVLKRMGLNAAQRVRFSGESVVLPDLSAADRRVIHLVLTEYNDVVAESEGEGRDRKLVVKPRKTG